MAKKRHRVGRAQSRHPIRIVRSFDAALDLIHGKTVKDSEGIEGVLKVDRSRPYDTRIMHVKTPKGRATEAYQKTRRELKDDWDTDLSTSESLVPIMTKLGVRFEHEGRVQSRTGKLRSMRWARGRGAR